MRIISFIFIVILSFSEIFSIPASAINIDSLRNELRTATGEQKLEVLREIKYHYASHPDSGLFYLEWYETESKKQKSIYHQCKAILGRIDYLWVWDYFQELEIYATERIPFFQEHKQYVYQYCAEEYLIETLLQLNKKDEAFQRAKKLYEESKALNLPEVSSIICRILGHLYIMTGKNEEACSFYKESVNYALLHTQNETGELSNLLNSYIYLAEAELYSARYQDLINTCDTLLKLLNKEDYINAVPAMIQIICYRVEAYFRLGNIKEAKACLDDAEKMIQENESVIPTVDEHILITYVSYYEVVQDYAGALRCINRLLEIRYSENRYKLSLLKLKANFLFKMKRYEEAAILHYEIADKIDSLNMADFDQKLDGLKLQYQTAEKENQILKQQSRLKTMRSWIFGISAAFIALTVIILLIWNYNKNIKRKNKNLTAQIHLLAAKRAETNMLRKQILEKNGGNNSESHLFDRLEEIMEKDKLFLKPDVNRDEVARKLLTNRLYLCDAVKEQTGLTFSAYIAKLRLEYAQTLLVEMQRDKMSLAVIGFSSGFNSVRTFSRSFKEAYGLTPGEFRSSVNSG